MCDSFQRPSNMQGWFSPDRATASHLDFCCKRKGHNGTALTNMEIGKWQKGKKNVVFVHYQDAQRINRSQDFCRSNSILVQMDYPIAFSREILKLWRRKGCALRFPVFTSGEYYPRTSKAMMHKVPCLGPHRVTQVENLCHAFIKDQKEWLIALRCLLYFL